MPLPDVVVLEFTAYCNLKCGFCFGPTDDRSVPNLSAEFWFTAIKWLADGGVKGISISGGEPTLFRELPDLLRFAKSLSLSVIVSTHGQLRERVLAAVPWIDWLALPIDGADKEMLAQMRGRPWGVDQASSLIHEVRLANPETKIKIGTVATRQNRHQVLEIGRELVNRRLPIHTWKIYQYTARRQFKHRAAEYHLDDEAYEAIRQEVEKQLLGAPFEIVFSSNSARRMAYLFVYPDGTVALPNASEGMDDIVVGNLHVEGPSVLRRVPALDSSNHNANYDLTYPGSRRE